MTQKKRKRLTEIQVLTKDITSYKIKCKSLKLVSADFYQIFVFPENDSPSKTMKSVLYFIKKALFVLEIFILL